MSEFLSTFLDIAFSLPTAPFTWLMMPVTLYWMLSLSGIFSLEWLDGADGALDGAVDGAADALGEAAAEAAADAAADALGDAAADAFGDGLAAIADGKAEAAMEAKAEILGGGGPSFHEGAGLGDVPRTFSWSLMVLFSWLMSLGGSYFVPGFQDLATKGLIVASFLAAGIFAAAMMLTAAAMKPVQRAMSAGTGTRSMELVGQTCTIRTQRVDGNFGQAEVDDGAMVIQVRSADSDGPFKFGGKAIIYQYDREREVYWVSPLDAGLEEAG